MSQAVYPPEGIPDANHVIKWLQSNGKAAAASYLIEVTEGVGGARLKLKEEEWKFAKLMGYRTPEPENDITTFSASDVAAVQSAVSEKMGADSTAAGILRDMGEIVFIPLPVQHVLTAYCSWLKFEAFPEDLASAASTTPEVGDAASTTEAIVSKGKGGATQLKTSKHKGTKNKTPWMWKTYMKKAKAELISRLSEAAKASGDLEDATKALVLELSDLRLGDNKPLTWDGKHATVTQNRKFRISMLSDRLGSWRRTWTEEQELLKRGSDLAETSNNAQRKMRQRGTRSGRTQTPLKLKDGQPLVCVGLPHIYYISYSFIAGKGDLHLC
jgi:hypothetical protein